MRLIPKIEIAQNQAPTLPSFKVADVSTAHITQADDAKIRELLGDSFPWIISWEWGGDQYGWLLSLEGMQNENLRILGFSDAFVNLFHVAYCEQGFDYLRLDRDADQVDGLPTFEW